MLFDDLDAQMRAYETMSDHLVDDGIFMVARLDGRSFTKLTKKPICFDPEAYTQIACTLDKPFDTKFRNLMVNTAEWLMEEFSFIYAYTQSDEISCLFPKDTALFNRKLRKLNSVLAGVASGYFSSKIMSPVAFDCRISQLPDVQAVVDYFRWREEDSRRNCIHGHCYWRLRNDGHSARKATSMLDKLSVAIKLDMLKKLDINPLPWQLNGVGLVWDEYEKAGRNPITGEITTATRRAVVAEMELPEGEKYSAFIRSLLKEDTDGV